MTAAERATYHLFGWSDQPDQESPGQFAFADAAGVSRILKAAGWRDAYISALDVPCTLSKADLAVYARRMGRVGVILPDLDELLQRKVTVALEEAFAEFLVNDNAKFDAACWLIRARAG